MNDSRETSVPGCGCRVRRRTLAATLGVGVLAMLATACGDASSAQPADQAGSAAAAPSGHAATPHGDHAPHHGGAVLMHRDLHYEVVLPAEGGARLYLTDAVREDLPASVVSSVMVEIARPQAAPEAIELAMDGSGEFWSGPGRPVTGPGTIVRVGFAYDNETVSVDLPFESYFSVPTPPAGERPTPTPSRERR